MTTEDAAAPAQSEPVEISWEDLLGIHNDKCPSVPTLTETDFEERALSRNDPRRIIVVAFFSRACPYCHDTAEVLEALVKSGRDVVKVDKDASRTLAARFAIGPVPTLLLFRGGSLRDVYNNQRTSEMLDMWIGYYNGEHTGSA